MTKVVLMRAGLLAACGLTLGMIPGTAKVSASVDMPMSGNAMARCTALTGTKVTDGTIEKASYVAPGGRLASSPLTGVAAALNGFTATRGFCRAQITLRPTTDSEIKVEAWLPDEWNGKMLAVGGGGFSGGLATAALSLRAPLAEGYASVATDVGHEAGETGEWAYGHREKLIDYGYRGNHLAAVAAKEAIRTYYRKAENHAFFNGCSNGGRDALMEVSRFPDDYDGVIAGAPASSFTPLLTSFVYNHLAISRAPGLTAKLPLLNAAALRKCDALDGVSDGVLEEPRKCSFDPSELQCKAGSDKLCLNAEEVSAARVLYWGPRLQGGQQLMSGYSVGGETTGWAEWITGLKTQQQSLGTEAFRWMVHGDPKWTMANFNLDRDYARARTRVSGILDSDTPDVRAFMRRGGKLIIYHGWNDAAIPPESTLRYFDAMKRRSDPSGSNVRLFMAPGMSHCFGGPGPNSFDMLPEIDRWVQKGVAPERVVATKFENDLLALVRLPTKVVRTRPLCAWPKIARYRGSGSTNDAASFSCSNPI